MKRWPTTILAGSLLLGAAAVLLAYGYFIEPSRLELRNAEIPVAGLDPDLDGLKIVLISDIHGGSNNVTIEKLLEVVDRTNEQDPDLIVLLGDYVSAATVPVPAANEGLKLSIRSIADGLAGLRAKLGVFAVLGNHDGEFSDQRVAAELQRVGFGVLQNEVAVVEKNGRPLRILGFKDHLSLSSRWTEISADAQKWLDGSGDGDIIALQHSPDIMPVITGDMSISPELRLVLAGHTHGGQIWLPIVGSMIVPSSFGQKYAYGHIKQNNVDLYVTSGVGTSILPFRFMVPPEIAVVTLRSQ